MTARLDLQANWTPTRRMLLTVVRTARARSGKPLDGKSAGNAGGPSDFVLALEPDILGQAQAGNDVVLTYTCDANRFWWAGAGPTFPSTKCSWWLRRP